jgi:hypothetical protein
MASDGLAVYRVTGCFLFQRDAESDDGHIGLFFHRHFARRCGESFNFVAL